MSRSDAALEAGGRVGDPAVERRGRSRRAGRRRGSTPSAARRAARAGVDGSVSTSTKRAVRPRPTATSRRRRRRVDDAVGRQGVEDLVGEDDAGRSGPRGRPASERSARRGRLPRAAAAMRLEPARLDLDRVVADDVARGPGRSRARPSRIATASVAGPRAVLAEDERAPAGRAGPRRPRRRAASAAPKIGCASGRGQEVAVAARAGPPSPGSSRRPGRTARGP